jgi:outer membrane protein assembly factor BamB
VFFVFLSQTWRSMNKCRAFLLSIIALIFLPAMVWGQLSQITNAWSMRVGILNYSSAALSPDGILYFGSWDHNLYAVSTNRYIKWKFETGLQIKSSPAIADDGTIYFGSRDRIFYAVTPEGKLKWSFATEGWVDSSPAIAPDGTVYFGSWDKKFYALNSSGGKKWVFATAGEIDSSPAIGADGTIYFGSHDKKLYALRPDGTKKWEFTTGGQITSSPAIDYSGNIYFASVDGKFYSLTPDGTVRWTVQTGGITESSPVIADDGSIRICINDFRSAISADGKIEWKSGTGLNLLHDSAPSLGASGETFYTTIDGVLTAQDPNSQITRMAILNGAPAAAPLIAPNGLVYIPTLTGMLDALQADAVLMNSAWPMFRANLRHTGVVNSPAR